MKAPKQLLNAVFFTTGLYCCLRRGCLCFSDFRRTSDPDVWTYIERASKNRQDGLLHSKLEHKTVLKYAIHSAGERCPVSILDLYFAKVPAEAIRVDSAFYLCPLERMPDDVMLPWFSKQAVGKNKLNTMVKTMCVTDGVLTKTNHSLRATAATEMFQASVPEKAIQKRSGH